MKKSEHAKQSGDWRLFPAACHDAANHDFRVSGALEGQRLVDWVGTMRNQDPGTASPLHGLEGNFHKLAGALKKSLTLAYELSITPGMELLDELKDLRETRGISQAEVAAFVGVDQSSVSYWETGKASPSRAARKLLQLWCEDARKRPKIRRAAA